MKEEHKIRRGEKTYAYIVPVFAVWMCLAVTFAAGISVGFAAGLWLAIQ